MGGGGQSVVNSCVVSRGWPCGQASGSAVPSWTKLAMQAEQCHLICPSATPFWLGTRRICLTRDSGFTLFLVPGFVATSGFGLSSPSSDQKRQPCRKQLHTGLQSAGAGVSALLGSRRHLPSHPCPVCGGHAGLVRGRGIRCAGFTLDAVSYCTRDELAGGLPLDGSLSPPGYKHWLRGDCRCGVAHAARPGGAVSHAGRHKDSRKSDSLLLPIEDRNRIYQAAIETLALRRPASEDLRGRGLTPQDIDRFGFRSLPQRGREHADFMATMRERFGDDLLGACPGFVDKNGRLTFWEAAGRRDGYLVPFRDEHGRVTGLQAKLLGGRYLTASGSRYGDIYTVAGERSATLFVTEGGLKAMVASVLGPAWCFGIPGQALHQSHISVIQRLAPERVAVALDREINTTTDKVRQMLLQRLADAGLVVCDAVWEGD